MPAKAQHHGEMKCLALCIQVVAVLFLALMIITQLNIFATRTPSLWWKFTDSTAPRPSVYLMVPVGGVLLAATFVAVYWPEEIQPDGGRGVLIGAGECTQAKFTCLLKLRQTVMSMAVRYPT